MSAPHDVSDQLRTWWFSRVAELANIDLQRRMWLDEKNTNPHWSYVEFVESYPDRDQLVQALNAGWLMPTEFKILSDLGEILTAHKAPGRDDYDHEAILGDPGWQSVVQAAERAKQQLLSITTDSKERGMLLGTE